MRYCPAASLVAVRVFSIRTGLDASTVAPGSTAPDESLTVPARATCAYSADGTHHTAAVMSKPLTICGMNSPLEKAVSPARHQTDHPWRVRRLALANRPLQWAPVIF